MFAATLLVGASAAGLGLLLGQTKLSAVCVGVVAAVVAWLVALRATAPYAAYLPFATTGGLVSDYLARHFSRYAGAVWTKEELVAWDKLVRIVAFHYGVKTNQILPSTRFVGDMEPLLDMLLKPLGAW
jgi:hypothetical protein